MGDTFAFAAQGFGAGQLAATEGGCRVGEVVFVTGSEDAVVPGALAGIATPGVVGKAMQGKGADGGGQLGIVGGGHAPFPGGDGFVGVERKAGDSRGVFTTTFPGLIRRRTPGGGKGVGGVFDHPKAMPMVEPLERGDVHHEAGGVHGDEANQRHLGVEGSGQTAGSQAGDLLLGVFQLEVAGGGVAVDQDGDGAGITEDFRGGGKGHGGDQHTLSGFEAQGDGRQMQGGGAGVERNGVARSDGGGEFFFKEAGIGAGSEPAGAEHLGNGGDFGFLEVGAEKRDRDRRDIRDNRDNRTFRNC